MTTAARSKAFDRTTLAFLAVLLGVTALRIWALKLSPLNLYYDEAQYWAWSRTLEWGYFTKPPMVAWSIWGTTQAFGNAEWAVRLAAPLSQSLAALALFAFGRNIYGSLAGFWSGVGWLAMPGIFLSSVVISTDALLLPFWALALLSMWRMVQTRSWFWAVALGVSAGLGLQAKYAMFYFPLCVALAAYWSPPVRAALKNGRAVLAAAIMLAIFAPNVFWNAQHGFETAQHTVSNVDLGSGNLFSISELFEFLGGQALLIGPILFIVLAGLFLRASRHADVLSDEDRFLLAFVLPPLVLVTIVAFVTRANANWAVTAYPAAMVWVVGNLLPTIMGRRTLAAGLVLNLVIGGLAVAAVMHPESAARFKGIRTASNWDETARDIAARAQPQRNERAFTAIMVDDRATFYELKYYWRDRAAEGAPLPPLRMWLLLGEAHNSAETSAPMHVQEGGRVLVVHASQRYIPFVAGDFTTFHTVGRLATPLGHGVNRQLALSVGEGFAPVARDAAFIDRIRARDRPHS